MMTMRALLLTAFLSTALPLAAQEPHRVTVEPSRMELEVNDSRATTVVVYDENGAVVDPAGVQWFTTTPDLVSVDAQGRITGLRPGEASLSVVAGSGVAFVTVRVRPRVARLELGLPGEQVPVGTSAPLSVSTIDTFEDVVPNTELQFESADLEVASVDALGRIYGRSPGQTTITVRTGEVSEEITIAVVEGSASPFELHASQEEARTGDVVRFRVTRQGSTEPVRPAWSVNAPGAQIRSEDQDGVFVAERPGTYRVTAQIGEHEARSATVRVRPRGAESRLATVGRGPIAAHHSGDTWVFEGIDGRDYAYIGTFHYDWAKVWDVTDPENPILTDSVQADARRINDVKIHPNNRLAVITREGASNRRNGIILLDLSDPAHPEILSEYTETVTGGVHNVWIDGENELVYAVHNGTSDMHIIDIADPRNPREVGRWGLEKQVKTLHDVIVQDGYAYLSYWDDGVIMLDVGAGTHGGSPRTPTFVSQFKYPIGNSHVAWRYGRYLFIGDEIFPDDWQPYGPIEARGYVHVVDYEDPENPVEVARYEVPEAGAHNLWAEDDKLYVGYYQAGLRVLDISGELRGDLYRQGRELAVIKTMDRDGFVPNWPMTWGAQVFKGNIFSSDMNSGLWVTRLEEEPAVVF
jgi:hypothetical protein